MLAKDPAGNTSSERLKKEVQYPRINSQILAKKRPRTPKKMLSCIKTILFIDSYITLHYFFLITEFNYNIHGQENFNQFFVFTVYIIRRRNLYKALLRLLRRIVTKVKNSYDGYY